MICMQKTQMRAGTHRDKYFCLYHAVLHAQNDRCVLGLIEPCNCGAKVAVLYAKSHRRLLGTIETCYSGPKVAVLHAKTTDEGWDP